LKIGTGVEGILKFCLSNLKGCNAGITAWRDLWSMSLWWLLVAWCRYQVSWRMAQGVQVIFRLCLTNSRGCNVGITKGRELWIMTLRWGRLPWYTCTYQV
jgi:hypothetical protein